jgi:hypothetical protein
MKKVLGTGLALLALATGVALTSPNLTDADGCKFTLVDHRFENKIIGIQANSGDVAIWNPSEACRIFVATLKVNKPLGRLGIFNYDFLLSYHRLVDGKEITDRSRGTALRVLGTSRNDEGALWALPEEPGGYVGRWAAELNDATEGFIEVGFLLEKGVDQVKVCVASPVDTVRLESTPKSAPQSGRRSGGSGGI